MTRKALPGIDLPTQDVHQRGRNVARSLRSSLPDIKPRTAVASLDRGVWSGRPERFPIAAVAPVVGLSEVFIRRISGSSRELAVEDVLRLLDQDSFGETFVPRSQVLDYLIAGKSTFREDNRPKVVPRPYALITGHVLDGLRRIEPRSVQCVVTSGPYWGMRIYEDPRAVTWADGQECVYGHEQTPEAFIRHTVQVLHELRPLLSADGSIWWNLGDTYNTRAPIRGNTTEALRAMQGQDGRSWADHQCRRYSAGHAFLKDGEQCMIPLQVAERASRIGYYVKSLITWAKTASLPEPHNSRVSRGLEYILHLSTVRTPKFDKSTYRRIQPILGGRNVEAESDKLTDVWVLPTSNGGHGHGAQFSPALPARCIALCTDANDVVLDPFVGNGSSGVAARALGRRFIGIDLSPGYLAVANEAISTATLDSSQKPPDGDATHGLRRLGRFPSQRGRAA